MNMFESNKKLLTSADIKLEDKIDIKYEPIESDAEGGLNWNAGDNEYQASSSLIEESNFFGVENIASVKTENEAYKNLIENDYQKMKSHLNVFKVKIEDVDLHSNLKADDDKITRQDIDAIKICRISELSSSIDGMPNKSHEEMEEPEGITDASLQSDVNIKKKFKCSHCNYETARNGDLKKHLLIHSNVKLFNCLKCNYSSKQKSNLKSHLITHTNVKLFKCSECNFSSNWKNSLKHHLLTHTNIKLFKCLECDYSCNQKGHLKDHLLSHADLKLFKCSECSFSSNWKNSLKCHLLTHADIKLLKCSECSFSSNQKYYLKKHILLTRH